MEHESFRFPALAWSSPSDHRLRWLGHFQGNDRVAVFSLCDLYGTYHRAWRRYAYNHVVYVSGFRGFPKMRSSAF